MKTVFAFVLLLLAASGTFFPCCMQDDRAMDTSTTSATSDSGHDKGACAPLFACTTCPVAAELHKPATLPLPVIAAVPDHQSAYHVRLSTFSSPFFQPPRSC